ncbi:hypothetical protein N9D28_01985 [Luminiphilus sp.]|nr:hypothetical protein [Luminiphilus sp.]
MSKRLISYAAAVNEGLMQAMTRDPKVLCYGLGVTDPKHVFSTTRDLEAKFGSDRVFDIPCSENAITGIGVGAALRGFKSVITHQRLDFSLLSMDQIVNSAAKWHYMFGSQLSVPITIRMILGRGWGQGPTHSQNLQAWFAHTPGLKVVCPSNASDAKGLLLASIFDPNPVIFLEHRWLHNSIADVDPNYYQMDIGGSKLVTLGKDITLVTNSYMVPECIDAVRFLESEYSISCDLIDMYSIRPLDRNMVINSAKKTGRLLCVDTASKSFSVSSEIISSVAENLSVSSSVYMQKLGLPDMPEPTSYALTKHFHLNADDVVVKVLTMCGVAKKDSPRIRNPAHHDVPGDWFRGPF